MKRIDLLNLLYCLPCLQQENSQYVWEKLQSLSFNQLCSFAKKLTVLLLTHKKLTVYSDPWIKTGFYFETNEKYGTQNGGIIYSDSTKSYQIHT
jgi:hypothetical protein